MSAAAASQPVPVVIIGATGRMGHALIRALAAQSQLTLRAAVTSAGHADLGRDAGELAGGTALGVAVSADLAQALAGAALAIDFSSARATAANLQACGRAGVPIIVGTTGLGAEAPAAIEAAESLIPVLVAANTSLALNVLLDLVRRAAKALPEGYDIEIFEAHHRHKVDAPSGTALALGDAAATGRGTERDGAAHLTGSVPGPRRAGGIGFSVQRGGDIVGEHEVRLLGTGEKLKLGHVATDRAIFARGALTAAVWLAGKAPGRYTMSDVLGLDSSS